MQIERGFPSVDRPLAARLFWDAFRGKLNSSLGPEQKALRFLDANMRSHFSFSAYDGDTLLGIVGFKTEDGGLIGGGYRDLAAIYGYLGATWRGAILSTFERELKQGQMLLDGIFVSERARGRGVGTALLNAVEDYAQFELCSEIRLDVIDTNPKAKALYERRGYQPAGQIKTGIMRPFLGFKTATTMIKAL